MKVETRKSLIVLLGFILIGLCTFLMLASVSAWSNNYLGQYSTFDQNDSNGWIIGSAWTLLQDQALSSGGAVVGRIATTGGDLYYDNINTSQFQYMAFDTDYALTNSYKTELKLCDAGTFNNCVTYYTFNSSLDAPLQDIVVNFTSNATSLKRIDFASSTCLVNCGGQFFLYLNLDNLRFGSSITENITYTSSLNLTRFLAVPTNTKVINAYLNITGLPSSLTVEDQVSPDGNPATNPTTLLLKPTIQNIGGVNKSIFGKISALGFWISRDGAPDGSVNISIRNTSFSILATKEIIPNAAVFTAGYYQANFTTQPLLNGRYYLTVDLIGNTNGVASSIDVRAAKTDNPITNEMAVGFNNSGFLTSFSTSNSMLYNITYNVSYTNNVSLYVSTNKAFNRTGSYSTSTKTNSLTSYINSYIASASAVGGYYYVPFLFHSDTFGLLQYSTLQADNVGFIENSQTYQNITIEGATENFILNMTYDPNYYTSVVGYLVYNGTTYASSYTGSGSNLLFNKTITIPNVNVNQNLSFYWNVLLYNGTMNYFNSTFKNQTVVNATLDNCSVYSNMIYNFTLKDEDTQVKIPTTAVYNGTMEVQLNISSLDGRTNLALINASYVNINPVSICLSQSLQNITGLRADGVVKYYANGYVQEFYNIQNATLTNNTIPQNINLFDLLTTEAQSFVITFKDGNFIPTADALIDITRFYIGEGVFKTVEIPKTDKDGRTVGHFITEDQVYSVYVRKNGVLLATFQNVRVVCTNVQTGDCQLILQQAATSSNANSFENNLGLSYLPSYNDTTKMFTFTFTSLTESARNVNLTIMNYDNYNNNTICSQSITSQSGTLICNIPAAYYNGTAIARVYVDGQLLSTNIFNVAIDRITSRNGGRFLLAFFLIVTLPFIAISSPAFTIVMFIVGLIAAGFLLLIDWGGFIGVTSAFLWFVISAAVLLWKVTRGRESG